ncbi:MAG: dTMP kinase [Gammaproteobacteria bacterium RIFCSPHIGHO2_12_FULL_40_19]|nr:MAG: dTMP kinase [Gammaproteobacteria bacterium RIFCSPHIGHO2_12_FULL_40_19]
MSVSFITLEGGEGVGKSTALSFIKTVLLEKNIESVFTREPGGTKTGEAIRDVLLHRLDESILPETELLLMFAARAQHIAHVIKPALQAGKTVVSDRFTDASFAYQGGGRGISTDRLQTLTTWVQGDLQPDLTLLLDAPVEIGLSRIHQRGEKDRIEQESIDFFNRVRNAYLERAAQFPKRFSIIKADASLENVQEQIKQALDKIV